jgi:hypothetical protein
VDVLSRFFIINILITGLAAFLFIEAVVIVADIDVGSTFDLSILLLSQFQLNLSQIALGLPL